LRLDQACSCSRNPILRRRCAAAFTICCTGPETAGGQKPDLARMKIAGARRR
jgi:hypothetical protein